MSKTLFPIEKCCNQLPELYRAINTIIYFYYLYLNISLIYKLPWRNWLARSAVNRKVGGSSPPGSEKLFKVDFILKVPAYDFDL